MAGGRPDGSGAAVAGTARACHETRASPFTWTQTASPARRVRSVSPVQASGAAVRQSPVAASARENRGAPSWSTLM